MPSDTVPGVLILGIILFGMLVGAAAQWVVVGRSSPGIDWGLALVAGLVGSFIGGSLLSLVFGDGFEFRPSGLFGSFIGAVIATYLWLRFGRSEPRSTAARRR